LDQVQPLEPSNLKHVGKPVADHHVHSEWSWDARRGSMERSCRRAVELGLPSIAFTEHADWFRGESAVVDAAGYLECVERCRAGFAGLRILTGIELGEPHRHPDQVRELLSYGPFDRLLGSLHYISWNGVSADASRRGFLQAAAVDEMFRMYLLDMTTMLQGGPAFDVLAHIDYPKRYWPVEASYDEARFEEEFRSVLREAARRGVALEINSTRGGPAERALCPGATVLRWWREEGGRGVSFGSDAHRPGDVAAGLDLAAQLAGAAGFKPQDDLSEFWVR